MGLIWLAVVAVLVSFLGYRLAQSYGLSGFTGLFISFGIYFVFVSDTWLQIYAWLRVSDNLLKALSGPVLVSCAILLAEKGKFFALFKLVSRLAPVTATFVALPQYTSALMRGETSSLTSLWESHSKGSSVLPPSPSVVPREAIKNNSVTWPRPHPIHLCISCRKNDLFSPRSGLKRRAGCWSSCSSWVRQVSGGST